MAVRSFPQERLSFDSKTMHYFVCLLGEAVPRPYRVQAPNKTMSHQAIHMLFRLLEEN